MKEGIYTTEFWLGLIAVLINYLNGTLGLHIPTEAVVSVSGVVITYILSRTFLKVRDMQATIDKEVVNQATNATTPAKVTTPTVSVTPTPSSDAKMEDSKQGVGNGTTGQT